MPITQAHRNVRRFYDAILPVTGDTIRVEVDFDFLPGWDPAPYQDEPGSAPEVTINTVTGALSGVDVTKLLDADIEELQGFTGLEYLENVIAEDYPSSYEPGDAYYE